MFKKFLSTLFSVTVIFPVTVNHQDVKAEETTKNKAIIVCPGTFGSGLFYRGEACMKYYKNEAVWMPLDNNNKWRMVKGVAKFILFNEDLNCNENGKPINENMGLPLEGEKFPHQVDADISKYGVGNSCKKLIDTLTKKFPDYDVFLHNYDWRSIDSADESLTKEIQSYDEVILIGYSSGGIVASNAAVQLYKMGQLNKIKKFISVAVPYNGTVEPFYVLEKGMVTENDFMGKFIEFLGIPNIISKMAKNCESTYQMLPSKSYFEKAGDGYITTDLTGQTLNYEKTLNFLKECNFAKKSDATVKHFLDESQKIYDSLLVDGKHILNFLDYHLVVGCGLDTMSKIFVDLKKHGDIKVTEYVDGDGSIALNESAIPFDNIENSRIFKVKGRHQFLIGDDKVVRNIIDTIKNKVCESTDDLSAVA